MTISVLILTLNESSDLDACLESVNWSDDIVVLDSGSTDGTQDIARRRGARVYYNKFEGYASQRNFGLSLPFKNSWVLMLDADERSTPEFHAKISRFAVEVGNNIVAAEFRRRDIWFGVWLKRAQISPYFVRLVRPTSVGYEREINERLVARGDVSRLDVSFNHYPFSKGIARWISRHNDYSTAEALHASKPLSIVSSVQGILRSSSFPERRSYQKNLFFNLPARPLLKLLYMLFVRGAILDGRIGIRYSVLQCIYEYFICLKQIESDYISREKDQGGKRDLPRN